MTLDIMMKAYKHNSISRYASTLCATRKVSYVIVSYTGIIFYKKMLG